MEKGMVESIKKLQFQSDGCLAELNVSLYPNL